MSKRVTAYILLIASTCLWGIGGPIVKYSFQYVTPFEFLFWRFLLVSVVCTPLLFLYCKKNPYPVKLLPKLIFLGFLCNGISLGLAFWGMNLTTVVEATIIASLTPMFVAVFSAYFLREPLGRAKQIGIVIAISGTVVAIAKPLISGNYSPSAFGGNLLIILSGLFWVAFVLLSKKWETQSLKPFHIVCTSAFVAVLSFTLVLLVTNNFPQLSALAPQATLGISYMAVFGTLVAFTAYATALKYIDAGDADIFSYLSPIWSIPLAIFWLGEKFDPILILSALLIITGVFLAERKVRLKKMLHPHHLAHHK